MEDFNVVFGERLKKKIHEHGMTQKMLADKAGITEAAISRYAKGERSPRIDILAKIASALDVTSDSLLGLEENL